MNGKRRGKWPAPGERRRGKGNRPARKPATVEELVLPETITSGRLLAWIVLQQHEANGRFITELLAGLDAQHDLPSIERAVAVDIASGVTRRRRTIDRLLESQVSRPRANIETGLWQLLRIGAFQLVFGRTPEHAAVDTTVELSRILRNPRWAGFINGVLRNVARMLTPNSVDAEARDSVPTTDGKFRQLAAPVFPDPVTSRAEYIADAFSLPDTLASRWESRLSRSQLNKVCFYSLAPPDHVTLRPNLMRASVASVTELLTQSGIPVVPGSCDNAIQISHASRIERLPGFEEGLWSVQDESAMAAGILVAPKPGERILDLCAAPGGKATHLAELSQDAASILACDTKQNRLLRIDQNTQRLRLSSVTSRLIRDDASDLTESDFDAVLVDVPCSNTGVLSRRPEARWRFRVSELEELLQLQTRLLLTAFDRVRQGGRIVYSTCSIEPEETTELLNWVVGAVRGLEIVEQKTWLPGDPADGAFQAVLIRR